MQDEYWTEAIPESIVLARVFVDHCAAVGKPELLEKASLPSLSTFAFSIQSQYNVVQEEHSKLVDARIRFQAEQELKKQLAEAEPEMSDDDNENEAQQTNAELEELEDAILRGEMTLKETLRMVLHLDFADELGRRTLLKVSREWTVLFLSSFF